MTTMYFCSRCGVTFDQDDLPVEEEDEDGEPFVNDDYEYRCPICGEVLVMINLDTIEKRRE